MGRAVRKCRPSNFKEIGKFVVDDDGIGRVRAVLVTVISNRIGIDRLWEAARQGSPLCLC